MLEILQWKQGNLCYIEVAFIYGLEQSKEN